MRKVMHYKALLFYALWTVWTLFVGLVGLPCLISRKASVALANIWCDVTFMLLRVCCGITVQWQPLSGVAGTLFAANHESTLDTLILWRALSGPAFILKRELLFIPVFGWYLWRVRPIAIRRGDKRSIKPMIAQARACLAQNRAVIIFPEGTRSAPEKQMPYKRGVALISSALKQSVTCLAVRTHQVWPKATWHKYAGKADILRLEPLPSCPRQGQTAWLEEMREIIHAARMQP